MNHLARENVKVDEISGNMHLLTNKKTPSGVSFTQWNLAPKKIQQKSENYIHSGSI